MKNLLLVLSSILFSTLLVGQEDFHLDQIYNVAIDGTIHVESEDAKVRIVGSDRADVHVKVSRIIKGKYYSNVDFGFKVYEKNGNLYVTETSQRKKASYTISHNGGIEYKIEVLMPKTNKLKVSGDDDDYRIHNIAADITIDNEDGLVDLSEITSDNLVINTEDGDVQLVNFSGRLDLRNEDGKLDCRDSYFSFIEVDMEDGEKKEVR